MYLPEVILGNLARCVSHVRKGLILGGTQTWEPPAQSSDFFPQRRSFVQSCLILKSFKNMFLKK